MGHLNLVDFYVVQCPFYIDSLCKKGGDYGTMHKVVLIRSHIWRNVHQSVAAILLRFGDGAVKVYHIL
jgi:hypothetical protein